jgi:hypothetical protein
LDFEDMGAQTNPYTEGAHKEWAIQSAVLVCHRAHERRPTGAIQCATARNRAVFEKLNDRKAGSHPF